MKKRIAIICAFIIALTNCTTVNASSATDVGLSIEDRYEMEIVKENVTYYNILEDKINSLEKEYDLSSNMPTEVLDSLVSCADVSKEIAELDETHIQITYNITSKEPVAERTFVSGNSEKVYSVVNYTYVVSTPSLSSGTITESSVESDITIKNTANYSYYQDGTLKMIRLDSGVTCITRFLESNLRDLVLNAYCIGGTNDGFNEERNSRTIATPLVNTNYSLFTDFNYFYSDMSSRIIYGATVTYSHGNSSYEVIANVILAGG